MDKTATVTSPFPGCPDGTLHPIQFKAGDSISGELAEIAVREKWAKWDKPKKTTKDGNGGGGADDIDTTVENDASQLDGETL